MITKNKVIHTTKGLSIGIDIGDKWSHYVVLGKKGKILEQDRIATDPEAMEEFLVQFKPSSVFIEIGSHTAWIAQKAEECGHQVTVANTREASYIYKNVRKCDQTDAETLARIGRSDPRILKPIKLRSLASRAKMGVLKSRDLLVKMRTMMTNHIRGLVKPFGVVFPWSTTPKLSDKMREQLPAEVIGSIRLCLEEIRDLNMRIKLLDNEIKRWIEKELPEMEYLMEVPGVGQLIASAFILVIDDPGRFQKSRDVGAFLGLVPRRDQSGEKDPELPISKAGNSYMRQLLVLAAQYILRESSPDSEIKQFGLRIAARGGQRAKKKAVVAVARKVAVLLHRLWVTKKS